MSERAIDPVADLLTVDPTEAGDAEQVASRPLSELAASAPAGPTTVHLPDTGRDAVVLGRRDAGIEVYLATGDLAVLPADTMARLASDPDAATLPGRALAALANWHHDLFAEAHRLHTDLVSARREHANTLAAIRDYAIARHKEGRFCRRGLNEALRTFDLPEYEPTFRVTYTITGSYDVVADSARDAGHDADYYLRPDLGDIDDVRDDTDTFHVTVNSVRPND